MSRGFLELAWVPGGSADRWTARRVARLADYLVFLRQRFALAEADTVEELHEMMLGNSQEVLDAEAVQQVKSLIATSHAYNEARVAVDGRLMPHEFVSTGDTWIKVDALDHHADDFLPGCRDIAWDLAGSIVELAFDEVASDALVRRYRERSGDRTIAMRLPFYLAAYLLYRIGYAYMAAESVGAESGDSVRFRSLAARYRHLLAARLARPSKIAGC